MVFRWQADDGPFIAVYLDPLSPHQLKKNIIKFGPPLTKLSGSTHGSLDQTAALGEQSVIRVHFVSFHDNSSLEPIGMYAADVISRQHFLDNIILILIMPIFPCP